MTELGCKEALNLDGGRNAQPEAGAFADFREVRCGPIHLGALARACTHWWSRMDVNPVSGQPFCPVTGARVFASSHLCPSAWPSAKPKLQPPLCNCVGTSSHEAKFPGHSVFAGMCWPNSSSLMLSGHSCRKTKRLAGPGRAMSESFRYAM